MKKKRSIWLLAWVFTLKLHAAIITCPDPETTSLKWGLVPAPWTINPFSPNRPQGEEGTQFLQANILVTSSLGQGVVCAYSNSVGIYSIWWQVLVKRPAAIDYNWIDTIGGFICTVSRQDCRFSAAEQ